MPARIRTTTLAGTALVLLAVAGCGGGTTAAAPAPTTPAATTPAATAPPGPAAPPVAVARAPRTQVELEQSLLALDDLPTGYALDSSAAEQDEEDPVTSDAPGCEALLGILNATTTAGAVATASVSLDGGLENQAMDETLDALPSDTAAAAVVAAEVAAIRTCPTVTLPLEGDDVPFTVSEISFAKVGDARFGARFTATSADWEGLEIVVVGVAVSDVVVHGTFFDAYLEEAEGMIEQAVDKVGGRAGTSTT